jgi:hypothetical protein
MSRPTRRTRQPVAATSEAPRRSPLVWLVYGLGVLAGLVLAVSALFTLGGVFGSDDVEFTVSTWPLLVWGGLAALAGATWLWRRRATRR